MNHQTSKEFVTCASVPLPRGRRYSRWINHESSQAERKAVSQLSRYHSREFGFGAISPNNGDWGNEKMEVFTICVDIEKWCHGRLVKTIEELIGYAMFLNDLETPELFQVYLLPSCRNDSHIHLKDLRRHSIDKFGIRPIEIYPAIPDTLYKLFALDKLNLHEAV